MDKIEQRYGLTYSTEPHNFGEVLSVFPVPDNWEGYRHHGYAWATPQDLIPFGIVPSAIRGCSLS